MAVFLTFRIEPALLINTWVWLFGRMKEILASLYEDNEGQNQTLCGSQKKTAHNYATSMASSTASSTLLSQSSVSYQSH